MRTRKIMLGLTAAAAIAAPIAVAGAAHASGAPVTQDTTVMVPTSATTVDLPALNSQFTRETLTITGGNSYFGPNSDQITWYLADGSFHASDGSNNVNEGWWTNGHGYGDLRVNGVHAGSVVYSLDGGVTWKALTSDTTFTNAQAKVVTLGYNDINGYFGDNTGTGFVVNVHRVKA